MKEGKAHFQQSAALSKPLLNKFKMEDGEKSEAGNCEYVTHCVALQCANTLLLYTGQWSFQYHYITDIREIQTVVRESLNKAQKQT
jgi:hypothetical protein